MRKLFEVPKTSIYLNRKKIDNLDNELRFNTRISKRGISFL